MLERDEDGKGWSLTAIILRHQPFGDAEDAFEEMSVYSNVMVAAKISSLRARIS